jgi:ribosomal protein S8
MKFQRVYEDELTIETWSFDTDKFRNGPISVDIKYKAGAEKAIKQNAKLVKQEKKTARQMKKINERNK